jgi:hypothetical protein
MLTCNAFADNTVIATQQTANCADQVYELSQTGLHDVQFMLTVLDALERAGIGPDIGDIPACDAYEALKNATCAVTPITSPGDEDPLKLQSLILYKLNEYLCSL